MLCCVRLLAIKVVLMIVICNLFVKLIVFIGWIVACYAIRVSSFKLGMDLCAKSIETVQIRMKNESLLC